MPYRTVVPLHDAIETFMNEDFSFIFSKLYTALDTCPSEIIKSDTVHISKFHQFFFVDEKYEKI